ncbi:MAG: ATP-binding cassette domain-containing protein [Anaerovoracaceae bacterium]
MDTSTRNYYLAIGKVQKCISNSETLEEAFQGSLRIIIDNCNAEQAVIWYADKSDEDRLHPYYWISPLDMMSKSHPVGEGAVGEVYRDQTSRVSLDFKADPDECTSADFSGVNVSSMICVPFSGESEKLGCIQLIMTEDGRHFTEEDADLCEIMVMMAAIAITDNEERLMPWKAGEVLMSLKDIRKEFTNGDITTKVLKGINLDIYKGEFLTLLGESGCGKSTLLNIMGGMDHATSGSIECLGEDYSNADEAELTEFRRDNIGFIFQDYNLMPNLNAIHNLDLIGELVENPMNSEEALELVGLLDKKASYPSQLSGGQRQRVSIARALVKRPRIIFADEPTAALDYETSIEVLSVMERIVESGTTLVMVTHNGEITRMADRVVHMRGGKIFEVTVNRHRAHAEELVW